MDSGNEPQDPGFIGSLLKEHRGEQFKLHAAHLNPQLPKVLKTIGYDRNYIRGAGAYLWDDQDRKTLDLMSGWGALSLGRNHPVVNAALREVLDAELPNLGQMDLSLLAGLLAKELLATVPGTGLETVFFTNSGTEAVEGAVKFARGSTGRTAVVSCDHAFHGLTLGALSFNGDPHFRDGFGSLLPDTRTIPFNDLEALERAVHGNDVAAFIVEPIQGKGVYLPDDNYLREAGRICREHGTVFILDEIQTGLGRTGKMWAGIEHWGAEPDIMTTAKSLSGGQAPVGAILCRKKLLHSVFSSMDRAVVHSSTFGQNNLAMAAGLASLKVLREEKLVERVAAQGDRLMERFRPFIDRYEFVTDVRGKGLMIGLEFGKPSSLKLRAAWKLLGAADESLFSQMVLIPLLKEHNILAQVAGHGLNVIKLLPTFVMTDEDCEWIVSSFDEVIASCHKIGGSLWKLGTSLASHMITSR